MKRSKIFLGVTTCLLGVAALAASKAKWHSFSLKYFTGNAGSACISGSTQLGTVTNTPSLTTVYGSGPTKVTRVLYTAACIRYAGVPKS